MLLSVSESFDDPEFIFEFKYDGARALLYCEEGGVTAVSRNGNDLSAAFPELWRLNRNVSVPCVLDGEIFGLRDGLPSFAVYQKRGMVTAPTKVKRAAAGFPIRFAAFDILQAGARDLTRLPLSERKTILTQTVTPNDTLFVADYLEEHGKKLFDAAQKLNLEGIIAKRKTSVYLPGKRSHDWFKIKNGDYTRG